jgi:hypothetical protein
MENLQGVSMTGLTVLLTISIIFNFLLGTRLYQMTKKLDRIEGGVSLSREEISKLKNRLETLKNLQG